MELVEIPIHRSSSGAMGRRCHRNTYSPERRSVDTNGPSGRRSGPGRTRCCPRWGAGGGVPGCPGCCGVCVPLGWGPRASGGVGWSARWSARWSGSVVGGHREAAGGGDGEQSIVGGVAGAGVVVVGGGGDVPAGAVDDAVVSAAQQDEVSG